MSVNMMNASDPYLKRSGFCGWMEMCMDVCVYASGVGIYAYDKLYTMTYLVN